MEATSQLNVTSRACGASPQAQASHNDFAKDLGSTSAVRGRSASLPVLSVNVETPVREEIGFPQPPGPAALYDAIRAILEPSIADRLAAYFRRQVPVLLVVHWNGVVTMSVYDKTHRRPTEIDVGGAPATATAALKFGDYSRREGDSRLPGPNFRYRHIPRGSAIDISAVYNAYQEDLTRGAVCLVDVRGHPECYVRGTPLARALLQGMESRRVPQGWGAEASEPGQCSCKVLSSFLRKTYQRLLVFLRFRPMETRAGAA